MCSEVTYRSQLLRTVGELREAIGPLVGDEGDGDGDDSCLCGIDVPATARDRGLGVQPNAFGYELTDCPNVRGNETSPTADAP